MSDAYISYDETVIYGPFAREQFLKLVVGLVPALDDAVRFCAQQQAAADASMREVLARVPVPQKSDPGTLDEARDTLVRFGKYVESIKGRPVALSEFYGNEAPSAVAKRRVVKLVAGVDKVLDGISKHGEVIPNAAAWRSEFAALVPALKELADTQLGKKVEQRLLTPEITAARESWLATYGANKKLIEGVLAHAGRPTLMPLIFDDLAETQRSGASDTDAPVKPDTGGTGKPEPKPQG